MMECWEIGLNDELGISLFHYSTIPFQGIDRYSTIEIYFKTNLL